jgi:hypothetical protein
MQIYVMDEKMPFFRLEIGNRQNGQKCRKRVIVKKCLFSGWK